MERLTVIEGNKVLRKCNNPEYGNPLSCCGCARERECQAEVLRKLAAYEDTGYQPNEIKKKKEFVLKSGARVFVVAKYTLYSSLEIVPAKVTKMSGEGDLLRFSVKGEWNNGSVYKATFSGKALGMKVFDTRERATVYMKEQQGEYCV